MTYPSYARRRGGGRLPSFLSALAESEDFVVLMENRTHSYLLGNCLKKQRSLNHNLYLLFLQHLSIQKSFKYTLCAMINKYFSPT